MATARWIEQCREAPIDDVILEAGLRKEGKGYAPCPICGAEKRGSRDRRGAIFPGSKKNGWRCYACEARGDGLNLVAQVLFQMKLKELDKESQGQVREWFAIRRWCDPDGNEPGEYIEPQSKPKPKAGYPPEDELYSFWKSCLPVHQDGQPGGMDMDVARFFRDRKWNSHLVARANVAKLTPHPDGQSWPAWWPKGRAGVWRLVVAAYDAQGRMRSMQGRAIVDKPDFPKVLWPKGHDAYGLIMADPQGVRFLNRKARPSKIIICEGLTDLIATSIYKRALLGRIAVLSCASGGFRALQKVYFPRGVPVYAATDEGDGDGKGDSYAIEIATYVSPIPVRRLPLSRFLNQP